MVVETNDDLTEVALVVTNVDRSQITEQIFLDAILKFYQDSYDLDFSTVIANSNESDLGLN